MTDEMPPNETASLPSLQSQTGGNMSVTADGRAIVTPSASDGQAQRDSIGMFSASDDQLLTKQVEETHVPNSSLIDVRPLFQLIKDIIARSIQTVFPAVPDDQGPEETNKTEVRDSLTAIVTIPDLPHIIDKIFCEIRNGKYIIMHGGDAIGWTREFTRQARTFAESAGIELEMIYVGPSHAKRYAISRVTADLMSKNLSLCWNPTTVRFFWQRIQSMLLSKIQLEQVENHSDIITQEIKKLLSNKRSPGGWALLAQGSTVVLHGQASTFHTVFSQYEEWKNEVVNSGFASAIQTHMKNIEIPEVVYCAQIDFPTAVGRIPKGMLCPVCNSDMEEQVIFVCFHEGAPASAKLTSPLPQAVPPTV